jgi:hypothetical protein
MSSIWENLMAIQHGARAHWFSRAALLVPFVVALSGCSQPKATVTGNVTYRSQPVPVGMVAFFGPDGQVASAPLGPDGSYAATGVPLGQVKVTVTTPLPGPSAERMAKNPMVKIKKVDVSALETTVSVPAKYNLPGTSGLGLTVTEGSQLFNIELK